MKPSPSRASRRLAVLGAGLLLVWAAWWTLSLRQQPPRLIMAVSSTPGAQLTPIPAWHLVGVDFQHNYAGTLTWLAGRNPYQAIDNDPYNPVYVYPPLTLAAFAWVALVPADTAITINFAEGGGSPQFRYSFAAVLVWMAALVAIFLSAARHTARYRHARGLTPLPFLLLAGAVLLSYPAMFELERGNCNGLVLLVIIGLSALAGRPRGWVADLLLAAGVVVAAGIKAYPGILLLGLLALRRYRAAAAGVVLLGLLLVALRGPFSAWGRIAEAITRDAARGYLAFSHSLASHWHLLWPDLGLPFLAKVPAVPALAAAVLAVVLPVGWRIHRSADPSALAWPWLLWLTAMGTFVTGISNDYNLVFVPLAWLALWDRRDPWWAHALAAAALTWLQPFSIGLGGPGLLLLKATSTASLGILLWRRAETVARPDAVPAASPPDRARRRRKA